MKGKKQIPSHRLNWDFKQNKEGKKVHCSTSFSSAYYTHGIVMLVNQFHTMICMKLPTPAQILFYCGACWTKCGERRKVKGLLDYLSIFSWFTGKSWWIYVNCSYANLFRDWTVSHSVAVKPLFLQIFSKIMVRRAANNKGIIRCSQTKICPS